ncbi:von Willebrand factor A domain-containing protein 1-like [Solea senegalensis]|uniref:von Willebrand factor A domain-containing protein 1 n=1 Tax=Solea senegalensis TaxID=28829 RepID=A0AAV6SMJ8_SOLSE|nr:von Willebrand factor A domain-containing protein 1 [Solea senegalensis]KAG7519265.1 von Willebrand factor A domain-containing protein 1-like [Solea senegalensis]
MESHMLLTWTLMCLLLRPVATQNPAPEGVLNCCEGDVLFLVDSSGSVSSYEHSRMLHFLSELLLPFSLGEDQVRVGLLQVGTQPRLEFGFDTFGTQRGLQDALKNIKPLRGDTNTVEALRMAKESVLRPGTVDGARVGLPRVLVWMTDGVKPGDVVGPMASLQEEGVAVLVVSTGHGNYQVLRQVVSPPVENHLYFVDIDDMSIITEDLRDAIIEIIRAERINVRDVSTNSATLQWRPVLSGLQGYYEIRFGPVATGGTGSSGGSGTGTSPSTGGSHYQRLVQAADSSNARLTGLKPDTTYTATLTPESNEQAFNTLSVTFTTQPEVLSPSTVTISESGETSVRVSWGPLQPEVTSYYIEYSALPRGKLHAITVARTQNSTLLRDLQPDTTYLVTVTARHASGKEKAMSVKVCTQEVTPALEDLQLTTVGSNSVQVDWKGSVPGLRGYWVTWEGQHSSDPGHRSSFYLPPDSLSTRLTHVPPSARVCVSPIYKTSRGEGLCCTAQFHSDAFAYGYQS